MLVNITQERLEINNKMFKKIWKTIVGIFAIIGTIIMTILATKKQNKVIKKIDKEIKKTDNVIKDYEQSNKYVQDELDNKKKELEDLKAQKENVMVKDVSVDEAAQWLKDYVKNKKSGN